MTERGEAIQRLGLRAPSLVRRIIERSLLWTDIDWSTTSAGPEPDSRRTTDDVAEAQVVSSESLDGHRPLLDLDFPAALVPSSTPGHHHLYIDKPMSWDDYVKLLDVLAEVGLLEPGFVSASKQRRATFLRLPWVCKGAERDPRILDVEDVEAYLADDSDAASTTTLTGQDPWGSPPF